MGVGVGVGRGQRQRDEGRLRRRLRRGVGPAAGPRLRRALDVQPLARRELRVVDLARDRPAEVPDVPGLVLVAGRGGRLRLRVADDPAVPPRVAGDPGAGPRAAPVRDVPRFGATGRPQVEDGAQLVLGVAGPGGSQERRRVAVLEHPAIERRDLGRVAAVARLHGERRPGRARRAEHRREVGERDLAHRAASRGAGAGHRHEVDGCVGAREPVARVEEAPVPVAAGDVAGDRVRVRAPGCDAGVRLAHGRAAAGPGGERREHGGREPDSEPAVRADNGHVRTVRRPGAVGNSPIGSRALRPTVFP